LGRYIERLPAQKRKEVEDIKRLPRETRGKKENIGGDIKRLPAQNKGGGMRGEKRQRL
jgi:hypothetical protein